MTEPEASRPIRKKDWQLTAEAFQCLLKALDEDEKSAAQKYEKMHWKLVEYFDRKKCLDADTENLADETLNRVARRLEEQDSNIDIPLEQYCYTVANLVFLEYLRKPERKANPLDDLPVSKQPALNPLTMDRLNEGHEEKERRLACLRNCRKIK